MEYSNKINNPVFESVVVKEEPYLTEQGIGSSDFAEKYTIKYLDDPEGCLAQFKKGDISHFRGQHNEYATNFSSHNEAEKGFDTEINLSRKGQQLQNITGKTRSTSTNRMRKFREKRKAEDPNYASKESKRIRELRKKIRERASDSELDAIRCKQRDQKRLQRAKKRAQISND